MCNLAEFTSFIVIKWYNLKLFPFNVCMRSFTFKFENYTHEPIQIQIHIQILIV